MAYLVYRKYDAPVSLYVLVSYTDVWYWDFDSHYFFVYRYPYQDPSVSSIIPDAVLDNLVAGGKEVLRGDSLSRDELTSVVFKLVRSGISGVAPTPSGGSITAANQLSFSNTVAQLPNNPGNVQAAIEQLGAATKAQIQSIAPASGSAVLPSQIVMLAGRLWRNPTTATILVPATVNITTLPAAGLEEFAVVTVDEVIVGTVDLTGAAPVGAKYGRNITTGREFDVVNGNWAPAIIPSTTTDLAIDLLTGGTIAANKKSRIATTQTYALTAGSAGAWANILSASGSGTATIAPASGDKIAGSTGAYSVPANANLTLLYDSVSKNWDVYGASVAATASAGGLEYSNWVTFAASAAKTRSSGGTFADYITARVGNTVVLPIEDGLKAESISVSLNLGSIAPITNIATGIKPVLVRLQAGNTYYSVGQVVPKGLYAVSYNGIDIILDEIESAAAAAITSGDSRNIPIFRTNSTQNVAPTLTEFPSPTVKDTAYVNLSGAGYEDWSYASGAWTKVGSVILSGDGRNLPIFRSNSTKDVAPTATEFPSPTIKDTAYINLNGTGYEDWSYSSGAWVKLGAVTIASAGQNKPIFRSNSTQDVAPTATEFSSPTIKDTAYINLNGTGYEDWSYASGAWVKVGSVIQSASGKNLPIFRSNPAQNVAPTATEFPTPTTKDTAYINLNSTGYEDWSYSTGSWVKVGSVIPTAATGDGATRLIVRTNSSVDVAPTATEFPTPTVKDFAIVNLNSLIREDWSYSTGSWVKIGSVLTSASRTKLIFRSNPAQNVAPTATEFPGPTTNDFAQINLNATGYEDWSYSTGSWVKIGSVLLSSDGSTRLIYRSNLTEDVAPTAIEFPSPTAKDYAQINLNGTGYEDWSYSTGAWVKVGRFFSPIAAPPLRAAEVVRAGDLRSLTLSGATAVIRWGGAAPRTVTSDIGAASFLTAEIQAGWTLEYQSKIPAFADNSYYPIGFEVVSASGYFKRLVDGASVVADLTDAAKWQSLGGGSAALATFATATTAGTAGLFPSAPAGPVTDILRRDGTYSAIPANGSLVAKYTPASGIPSGTGVRAGDYYIVESDGLLNQPFTGITLKAGDEVVAIKATPSVAADWYLRARATAYQAGTIDNVVAGDTVEHTFTGSVARDSILRVNNRNSSISLYSTDSNLIYGSTVANGARYAISATDGKVYRATVATVTDRAKDPSANPAEWTVLQSAAAPALANGENVSIGDLRAITIAGANCIIRYAGASSRTTGTAATTTGLATEFGNGWELLSQDVIPSFSAGVWYPKAFEVVSAGVYYRNLITAVGAIADLPVTTKWQVLAGVSTPPAPAFTDGEVIKMGMLRSVTIAGVVTTARYGGTADRTINVLSIATDLSTEFNAGWALISQSQIPTFSVGVWYPAGFEVTHSDGHYRNLVSGTGATSDLIDPAKWQLLATIGGFLLRDTIANNSTTTLTNLREYVGAAGITGAATTKLPSATAEAQRIEFVNADGGNYTFGLATTTDRLNGVVNGTITTNRIDDHLIFVRDAIGNWSEINRKTQYEFSLGALMGWPGAAVPDDGWLPMSGGVYNRIDYPDLSALISAGSIAITASTTATTFTLKNLNTGAAGGAGYFLGGLGGQAAGTLQDDATAINGLRDTGHVHGNPTRGEESSSGALTVGGGGSTGTYNTDSGTANLTGDTETRPYTARVLWVVRAKPQPLILGAGASLNINSQTIRHTVTFASNPIGLASEFTWSLVRIPVTAGQQLDTVSASIGQAYIVDALGGTVGVIAPPGGGTINITKTEIAQTYAVTLGGAAIAPPVAVRLNSWTTIKIPVTAGQRLATVTASGGTSPQAVIKDAVNGLVDVLATTAAINLVKTEEPLTYAVTLAGAALSPAVAVTPNSWTTIKIPVTVGQRLATIAVTGGTSPGANILDPNNGLVSVLATTAAINLVKTETPLTFAITNAGAAFVPAVAIASKSWTMLKLTVAAGRQLATVTAAGGTAPKASIIDPRSGLVAVYLDDAAIDITSTNEAIANTLDLVQTAKFTWENKSLVTAGGESSSFIKSTQSSTGSAIDLNTAKSRVLLTQGFTYRVRVQVTRGAAFTNWVAYKVQGDLGAGTVDIPDTAFYFGDDNSNYQGGGGTEFYLNVPSTATAPYSLWLLRTNSGGNGNSSGEWNVEAIAKESGTTLPAALPIRTITNANGSNVNGVASVPGYDGFPVQIQVTLTAGRAIASASITNGTISVLNPLAGLVLVTPNSGNPVITITDTATSPLFSNWQKDVSTYTDNTWRTVSIAAETNGLFAVNASGELTFARDAVIDASITNLMSEGSGLSLGYKIQTRGTGNVWYDVESLSVNNPASGVTPFVVKTSGLGISTGQMLRFQVNVNNGGGNAYPGARTVRLFVGEQLSTFVVPVGTTTRTICTVTGVGANINGNATAQILGGTSGAITATVPANQRLATVTGSAGLTVAIEEAVTGRISYSLTEGTITATLTMTFTPIPPNTTNVTAMVDGVAANVNGSATFAASNGGTRSEVLITLTGGRQIAGVTASGGATVGITNPRSGSVSLLIPAGLASCALTVTTVASTARCQFSTANSGIAITFGTIQLRMAPSGNRSMQIKSASGNLSLRMLTWLDWQTTNQPTLATVNDTTWGYISGGSSYNYGAAGNIQNFIIEDVTSSRFYRGQMTVGPGYNSNWFMLEEII